MYFSFKGNITHQGKDFVVIEVNNIGYQVYVPHVNAFPLNETRTIYLYNVVREDEQYLAGFSSIEEKEAFEALIKVKGIGPRTALNALSATTGEELINAIKSNNITFLRKLPGIGGKAAAQILLDLRGVLDLSKDADPNQYDEVKEALKSLKFKVKEIDDVLASINIPNATNEQILREALKKLKK